MDKAQLRRVRDSIHSAHGKLQRLLSEYGKSAPLLVKQAYEDLTQAGQDLGMWDDPKTTYREIREEDVGQMLFYAFGREWRTADFIGRIMEQDVGKRVYKIKLGPHDYILQVENDQQLEYRLRKGK
jgi:hypothetical protein